MTVIRALAVFLGVALWKVFADEAELTFAVRKLVQCPGKQALPVFLKDMQVMPVAENRYALNGTLIIRRILQDDIWLTLSIRQCLETSNPDSCEYVLKKYEVRGLCELLGKKNEMWTKFVEQLKFDKCPIPANDYRIDGVRLSPDILELIPDAQVALWKLDIGLYGGENGLEMGCVNMEIEVHSY